MESIKVRAGVVDIPLMSQSWERAGTALRRRLPSIRRAAGLTLAEAMLAMAVVSAAVLTIAYATTAGHQHLRHGEDVLRAIRLAEDLMEEVAMRPWEGGAGEDAERAEFHLDDYDGFTEAPGELAEFTGERYDSRDQVYSRRVNIDKVERTVRQLDDLEIVGKRVTVTVECARGQQWQLERFIPEPG